MTRPRKRPANALRSTRPRRDDHDTPRLEDKSTHILSASATLLGLCFVVLTSLRAFDMRQKTVIDELTAIAMVIFMAASILSFLSIRSRTRRARVFERIADNIFLVGLLLLFVTTMLLTFDIVD